MAGPHDAAGVKILLHEPRETPSVHGLGQAVATGTHAFVGVKFMMVRTNEWCNDSDDDMFIASCLTHLGFRLYKGAFTRIDWTFLNELHLECRKRRHSLKNPTNVIFEA